MEDEYKGWEKLATPQYIRLIHKLEKQTLDENALNEARRLKARYFYVPPKTPVRSTTPLFDISQITFKPLFDLSGTDRPVFKLSGFIKLVDITGKEYSLLDCGMIDAKTVVAAAADATKSAILDKYDLGCPFLPPSFLWLKFCLGDSLHEDKTINEECMLNLHDKVVYDEEQQFTVSTKSWLITMRYTVFRCAVIAQVIITIFTKEETGDQSEVRVGGTLSAKTPITDTNVVSYLLFNRNTSLIPAYWDVNAPIELPEVAVPAYSMLSIDSYLEVNGEQVFTQTPLKFEPGVLTVNNKQNILGEKWRIQVRVKWRNAFDYLEKNDVCEFLPNSEVELASIETLCDSPPKKGMLQPKKMRPTKLLSYEEPISFSELYDPNVRIEDRVSFYSLNLSPEEFSEVFSVYVVSLSASDADGFLIYGKISCTDPFYEDVVFDVSEENPIMVRPHKRLPLVFPRRAWCWSGLHFTLGFDLKNSQGDEICKGRVQWHPNALPRVLEKRTCSVFMGKHGYAAVRFSIFESALCAKVSATLSSDASVGACKLYGRIRAAYSCYEYLSPYVKKYYQNVLFKKKRSECETLGDGVEIPLSKCTVAVPSYASLTVEVKLGVLIGDKYEALTGDVTFEPLEPASKGLEPASKGLKINGESCSLILNVNWC